MVQLPTFTESGRRWAWRAKVPERLQAAECCMLYQMRGNQFMRTSVENAEFVFSRDQSL